MRTKRAKRTVITADNYDGYKKMVGVIPPFKKGNEDIRKALNFSTGAWTALRTTDTYAEYKAKRSFVYPKKTAVVVENGEFTQIPKGDGQIAIAIDGAPQPRQSTFKATEAAVAMSTSDMILYDALKDINQTLIRLCKAWESTPTYENQTVPPVVKDGVIMQPIKRGWLR